jgi:hypothetical protein
MLNSIERREALKKAVCSIYGVNEDELFSLNRRREIISARRMVLYFLRKHYGETYMGIAKMFNMNHATVIHHVTQMKNFLEFDKIEIMNYIKVRDYVFEQNSEVTLSEELDLLKKEKSLLDNRLEQVKTELNLLDNGN